MGSGIFFCPIWWVLKLELLGRQKTGTIQVCLPWLLLLGTRKEQRPRVQELEWILHGSGEWLTGRWCKREFFSEILSILRITENTANALPTAVLSCVLLRDVSCLLAQRTGSYSWCISFDCSWALMLLLTFTDLIWQGRECFGHWGGRAL